MNKKQIVEEVLKEVFPIRNDANQVHQNLCKEAIEKTLEKVKWSEDE